MAIVFGRLTHRLRFLLLLLTLLITSCQQKPMEVKVLQNLVYGNYNYQNQEKALLLDLYLPETKPEKPLPLLIYIHGGGWLQGTKEYCPGKIVVQRNYAMACISYRFSNEALFPAQIQDVKTAVRWLRKNADKYDLDPKNVGAWGPSSGGHLSALLGTSAGVKELEGTNNPEISSAVQAVCAWYPLTDFTKVPPAFEESITPAVEEKYKDKEWYIYTLVTHKLLGGPVSQKLELAAFTNPINYIDAQDPPFLIMHGEKDNVVPMSQSVLLADALSEKGVEVQLEKKPDWGHYHGRGEAFDPALIDMAMDFFDKHLGVGKLGYDINLNYLGVRSQESGVRREERRRNKE
ncbi:MULTISPECIES: alpha/beta hydrolase [Okeania]|uniref:Alpha/beta hydrolase n=1 Tax=Okeania hirsuta TaxID=1458930 RepID=A0A3N6PFL8_9CYAN|nr:MULTISPECIES: alpha/beta hydrolase [Okeania]NEP06073.1 alpha/beta hydrolase [Okeania sp. SIO4D6]NEP39916.1 alpha/beta hydrolase [Okeania sp. SIO2H7]NEP71524.1 alpha/beta hydrolase [Okeania sp. SIO2G5]NEP88019.1 alpha/beta hydrolase [Okeania sp. SIO2C2]NEP92811.1 alpha/beta hydrolase [Okeania sp. SIO2F5]